MSRYIVVSRNSPTVVRFGPGPDDTVTLPAGGALAVSDGEPREELREDPPRRPPIVVRPIEIEPIGPLFQMPARFDEALSLLDGAPGDRVGFSLPQTDRFDLRDARPLARRAAAQGKRLLIELG